MPDRTIPLGDCPYCGADDWSYTEVSIWHGRKCGACGGTFLHDDLTPAADDLPDSTR